MGLDISGRTTGHSLGGGYSRLHNTARYLALKWCAMPSSVGKDDVGEDVDAFSFYMYPWVGTKQLDHDKLDKMMNAVQSSGYFFPNLCRHSDCEGNYTKNGEPCDEHLMKGNSVQLLKELELLCSEETFVNSTSERVKAAMEYTVKFRDLVKDEIENGCGTVDFH